VRPDPTGGAHTGTEPLACPAVEGRLSQDPRAEEGRLPPPPPPAEEGRLPRRLPPPAADGGSGKRGRWPAEKDEGRDVKPPHVAAEFGRVERALEG